jgi:prepilin-type N-terminal cleavage/methylation domain-containing protein
VRPRNGFTLVETLIALVVVSLLMLIVFPKVGRALVRHNLRGARTTVVNAAALARAAAQEGTRVSWLKFDGTQVLVVARPRMVNLPGSDADTVGTVRDLAEAYGVTMAFTAGSDSIRFSPSGLGGLAGNHTVTLSHGSYSELIQFDGLGRIQK